MYKQLRVPVGATPKSIYATWNDHREAMRTTAADTRSKRLAARRGIQ